MSDRQIKTGAIISYGAIFFNIVAGLVYTPWMVRQIGVSDYGLYTLSSVFLSYFLIDFGLAQSIARFIAKYRAENDQKRINNLLGITTRIYLLIDGAILLILIVLFFFLSQIFGEFTPLEIERFKIVYLIAGFFSLLSFPLTPVNGAMIAYERFVVLKMTDLIQKVLIIGLMVIALLYGYGLFALIFINGLVGFALKVYNLIYLRRKERIRISLKYFDRSLAKELFSFSVWVFLIGIAQRFKLNIIPTILGALSGTKEIAIFSVAMILEGYTFTFAQALNGLFLPKVTRMISAGENRREITDLMIRVGRIQFLIIGLLISGIMALGKPFIQLWMGEIFKDSYVVALLIIVPGVITLTQEIASTLMYVVNEIKYRAILYLFASGLSVALGIWLAPKYGAIGGGIGVAAGLIIFHVVAMNLVYSKIMKLDIKRFLYSVHFKMFIPFVLAGLATYAIQNFYAVDNWVSFLAVSSLFSFLAILGLWIFSLNTYEKNLILSLVRRNKR